MKQMKNSHIEWIGKVPFDWTVEKGKHHFTSNKYIPGIKASEYDRLALTLKGVISRSKNDSDGLQPKDFNTYQLLKENELVFKLIDLQNVSTSRVGLAHATGLVSPAYIVLHAGDKILPEYAEKFYLMMWYREIFNALGDNGVRSNLGVSDLLNIPITIPPLATQKSIANFLDKQCSVIDSLSSDILSQINILEEYKKSIATETITKGLNPDVEMKDSGIKWIGEVPVDWVVEKGKFHFSNNKYIPGIKSSEYDRLALTLKGVINRSKDDADGLQPKDFNTYQLLRENELVFKLIDLQNVSTSRVGLAHATGLVSPAYIVLHARDKILPEYAEKFYLMMWHREIFNALGDNGVRSNLGVSDLLNVPITVPPLKIQKSIANFLDQKCSEINAVIADKKAQLETLAEYKKSLIYEYVTGKKEVPDVF